MITRSAVNKSFASKCEITKALPFTSKNKTKSSVKTKMGIKTPKTAYSGKFNSETNVENVQSPVFNIHVHMPTVVTSDLNKSGEIQPVIHLHFDELFHKVSPNTTSKNFEIINKTAKVELPSEVNYSSEEQSNLCKSRQLKPKKKKFCKRLSFSGSEKSMKNLKTEKSEAVSKSVEEIEEKEEFSGNSCHEIEFPLRRSIRLANNRKLLKALKDLSANESVMTKIKAKRCRSVNTENKLGSSEKILDLKDPMVVLHDVMKEGENLTFDNNTVYSGQATCFSCVNTNACDLGGQEKVKQDYCDSLFAISNKQNSKDKKENEMNLKKSSDDQNMISVSKKFGEIYPLVHSSDTERNSVTDVLGNCALKEVREILQNVIEPERSEEDVCDSSLEVEDGKKVAKNNQDVNNVLLLSEKDNITTEMKNNLSVLLSNDEDLSLNVKHNDINDDKIVSINSKSNSSTLSYSDKSHSDDSDSDLSDAAYFVKDNHQTASLNALDLKRVKNCMNGENNNLVKNVNEENKLSSEDSNDYKAINVNTLNFQLQLINKEMKSRNITVKKKSNRRKFLNKKEALQNYKEGREKSPATKKKMELPKKITTNMSAGENKEKPSARDYIPLQISGTTKFAVAQLSKIKPYSAHKAKNFKNEMLFGKRINRYSNPKYLETLLLKKKAAAKRNE